MFDNVVLVAADTNNLDHAQWVDRIRARKRIYISINEEDRALQVSRMKSGAEQLARLGHYPSSLEAKRATYIQFTDAAKVGRSHSYFEGEPIKNPKVRQFFLDALNGRRAHQRLNFNLASKCYQI